MNIQNTTNKGGYDRLVMMDDEADELRRRADVLSEQFITMKAELYNSLFKDAERLHLDNEIIIPGKNVAYPVDIHVTDIYPFGNMGTFKARGYNVMHTSSGDVKVEGKYYITFCGNGQGITDRTPEVAARLIMTVIQRYF
jgi:hypothetical protein